MQTPNEPVRWQQLSVLRHLGMVKFEVQTSHQNVEEKAGWSKYFRNC